MQYYTEDVREKLFARRPGGFDPQSWFIVQNTTDNSYMYVCDPTFKPNRPLIRYQQDCQV